MSFPSIWLTLGVVVLFFTVTGVANALLQRLTAGKNAEDQPAAAERHGRWAWVLEIIGFWLPALTFYALTGNFPWTFAAVAIVLLAVARQASSMIEDSAGIYRGQTGDMLLVNYVFLTRNMMRYNAFIYIANAIFYIAILVLAYLAARRADLASPDGLFSVGIWVFLAPAAFMLVMSAVTNVLMLSSRLTPRQIRVYHFSLSVRTTIISGWTLLYPFLAFQQDALTGNPTWLWFAVAGVAAYYGLTVLLPFEVGRHGFAQLERQTLRRLRDDSLMLGVATDPNVSPEYRAETFARLDEQMTQRFKETLETCEFYRTAACVYDDGAASPPPADAQGAAPSPAPMPAEPPRPAHFHALIQEVRASQDSSSFAWRNVWAAIAKEHAYRLTRLDYRIFALDRMQRMLRHWDNPGWVRGLALQTERETTDRLALPESKSALLGTLAVVGSTGLTVLQRIFEDEIRIAFGVVSAAVRAFFSSLGLL